MQKSRCIIECLHDAGLLTDGEKGVLMTATCLQDCSVTVSNDSLTIHLEKKSGDVSLTVNA